MSVNMKSTKQEIMDAYNAVKEKLDAITSAKDDPAAVEMENKKAAVLSSANDIVGQGILSPEIVSKYNDLCEAIKMKQEQIKTLYGIEAELNSMVALVNAHKDKEVELKEKYKALERDLQEEYTAKKAEMEAEITILEEKKVNILAQTKKDNDELKAAIKQERDREREQYDYDLRRSRKVENDKWEDEKAEREKALAEKEALLNNRIIEVEEKGKMIAELQSTVDNIPVLIENARADGKKEGKAEADKSHVFEVRSINTKNEYEQKSLNDQIVRLTADLEMARNVNAELQNKLDAAYAQMKDLAADTVKSNGSIKIIGGDSTNKVGMK